MGKLEKILLHEARAITINSNISGEHSDEHQKLDHQFFPLLKFSFMLCHVLHFQKASDKSELFFVGSVLLSDSSNFKDIRRAFMCFLFVASGAAAVNTDI